MATARTAKNAASNIQLPPRGSRRNLYDDALQRRIGTSEHPIDGKNHRGGLGIDALKKPYAAIYATEELEETAKLFLSLHAHNPRYLTLEQIEELERVFRKVSG